MLLLLAYNNPSPAAQMYERHQYVYHFVTMMTTHSPLTMTDGWLGNLEYKQVRVMVDFKGIFGLQGKWN